MLFFFKRRRKTGSLTVGMSAEVEGVVTDPVPTAIPEAGIKCVCYTVVNEAWKQGARGRGRKMWIPQAAHQGGTGFYLEDDEGRIFVLIKPEQLDLRGGWSHQGVLGKKGTRRYFARSIQVGDKVRVLGQVVRYGRDGELALGSDGEKGMRLVQVKKAPK